MIAVVFGIGFALGFVGGVAAMVWSTHNDDASMSGEEDRRP